MKLSAAVTTAGFYLFNLNTEMLLCFNGEGAASKAIYSRAVGVDDHWVLFSSGSVREPFTTMSGVGCRVHGIHFHNAADGCDGSMLCCPSQTEALFGSTLADLLSTAVIEL